jgi:acyl carrier protein
MAESWTTAGAVPAHAVAITGMACKFPGADSVDDYWKLLDEGRSMVTKLPDGRFTAGEHWRSNNKSIFTGNFINDIEAFDHKFFGRSSREAATMDPGQRLLLETAYQALESSGFFRGVEQDRDVGCFIGACLSDYNDNVASHPPNAFSALGSLRAFLPGRISHFFGLTGPAISFDTACSSSAVAIDAAIKALRAGDCTSAIAGGVSVFTSPHIFQNLAGASFLSPTGATKSFDELADGYSRGEGVGLVVLKTLSQAVADGDHILGTILSTAVKQNSNLVPITVPYSPSQVALYGRVLERAGINADDVTYLEAHGTGTPIGDPEEFKAIKEIFDTPTRSQRLHFASVKGNIGHSEAASGVAGLIKTLLMIQHRAIPRQASFKVLNSKIDLCDGQLSIPTETVPWKGKPLIACISNHGAAGSTSAMVIREPFTALAAPTHKSHSTKFPVIVSGNCSSSLRRNCAAVREYLTTSDALNKGAGLADIAFNLSEKQNRDLSHIFSVAVTDSSDLYKRLDLQDQDLSLPNPEAKPVILVFGGQQRKTVTMERDVYDSCTVLRKHLDECDRILHDFGHQRIIPGIFDAGFHTDAVFLQTAQFAIQYATAMTWLDCGLKIECVIGHSLGQLAALVVSGVLSLYDGLKLVYHRALLIRDQWGPETGAMLAVFADLEETRALIASIKKKDPTTDISIACYNGPKNHVLAGSRSEIELVVDHINRSRSMKYVVLDTTHGFHSRLADPILHKLRHIASGLTYRAPTIHVELCSQHEESALTMNPMSIAEHTRHPVYFDHAIKRIEKRYGHCTWIEGGSDTSIMNMLQRCLPANSHRGHDFRPVSVSRFDSLGMLADTVAYLWTRRHHVQFWPFARCQRDEYRALNLPPYSFEKTKHWLDFKLLVDSGVKEVIKEVIKEVVVVKEDIKRHLLTFAGFQDASELTAVYNIDPLSEEWQTLCGGHSLLNTPLCPAALYVELILRATKIIVEIKKGVAPFQVQLDTLEIQAALGIHPRRGAIKLYLTQADSIGNRWTVALRFEPEDILEPITTHAVAKIDVVMVDDGDTIVELARFGKLIQRGSYDASTWSAIDRIHGPVIYQIFSKVVQYHDYFHGVQDLSFKNHTIVAEVVLPKDQPMITSELLHNPVAIDTFLQVPGLYLNCLSSCKSGSAYINTSVERLRIAPDFEYKPRGPWKVIAVAGDVDESGHGSFDVFVTDPKMNSFVVAAFTARFRMVSISSLTRGLAHAYDHSQAHVPVVRQAESTTNLVERTSHVAPSIVASDSCNLRESRLERAWVEEKLSEILQKVADVPVELFRADASLEELGVDSLMWTEVVTEAEKTFGFTIPRSELQKVQTVHELCEYIQYRDIGVTTAPTTTLSVKHSLPRITTSRADFVEAPLHSSRSAVNTTRHHHTIEHILRDLAEILCNHASDFAPIDIRINTNLNDLALDSLLAIEFLDDVKAKFNVTVDIGSFSRMTEVGQLAEMIYKNLTNETTPPPRSAISKSSSGSTAFLPSATPKVNGHALQRPKSNLSRKSFTNSRDSFSHFNNNTAYSGSTLGHATNTFRRTMMDFEKLAHKNEFAGFYENVYGKNCHLVLAYVVEAYADLGINLATMRPGSEIPELNIPHKHHHMREVLKGVLVDGGIAVSDRVCLIRTEKPVDPTRSSMLFEDILREFPQHTKEHMLLNITGSEMAQLLTGAKDPLAVLFGSKANRQILEDVYSTSPMYVVMSQLLTQFLESTLSTAMTSVAGTGKRFRILEVGAGTGATTRWVVGRLVQMGIPVEYTFTDISASLVQTAKRKFAQYDCMKYTTLDIERQPPVEHLGQYDIVLATNCIHATSDLRNSLKNINQLLKPEGFVALVEFTTRMPWFDMVFGLLEGWWLFQDGRGYVLAEPQFWEECMLDVGFNKVMWSGGSSRESNVVRVISGFKNI